MIDLPPPSYEQTIQAIAECHILRASVRIKYEDEMQSDVITISDLGEVTEGKLRCLKNAVHPFYILMIENDEQQAQFYEFSEREDRPRERAEAIEWLRSNGLTDRLPVFDPRDGLEEFARALEMGCGLPAGSALASDGPSSLTLKPEFITGKDVDALAKAFGCITRMFAATEARDHGVTLGFVGNQAVSEGD